MTRKNMALLLIVMEYSMAEKGSMQHGSVWFFRATVYDSNANSALSMYATRSRSGPVSSSIWI